MQLLGGTSCEIDTQTGVGRLPVPKNMCMYYKIEPHQTAYHCKNWYGTWGRISNGKNIPFLTTWEKDLLFCLFVLKVYVGSVSLVTGVLSWFLHCTVRGPKLPWLHSWTEFCTRFLSSALGWKKKSKDRPCRVQQLKCIVRLCSTASESHTEIITLQTS